MTPLPPNISPWLTALERELDDVLRPATARSIVEQLARLSNHFRGERSAASWDMLFEDYALDLEGISSIHLAAALDETRTTRQWFPKVADLMSLWHTRRFKDAERLRRTRALLGKEPPKAWERP